jgi:predicted metal-dependent hydrolase
LWRAGKPVFAYFKKDFHPLKVGQQHLSQQWLASHQDQWSPVGQQPTAPAKA